MYAAHPRYRFGFEISPHAFGFGYLDFESEDVENAIQSKTHAGDARPSFMKEWIYYFGV